MGMILVRTGGSFPTREQKFSALEHGHARAVADAIKHLSDEVLPAAIREDHNLHEEGSYPLSKFGKD